MSERERILLPVAPSVTWEGFIWPQTCGNARRLPPSPLEQGRLRMNMAVYVLAYVALIACNDNDWSGPWPA